MEQRARPRRPRGLGGQGLFVRGPHAALACPSMAEPAHRRPEMNAIDVRAMTAEQKESFHKEAEAKVQVLKYASPYPANPRPKDVVRLGNTGLMTSLVQIVRE